MNKEKLQSFIDENVNPGLAMHGGFLTAQEFDIEQGILYVTLGGGCHGCSSAKQTMMYGVEHILKEEFPGIKFINDITDHAQGQSPFYD